ncbi:MAG TPA: SRPBCC domain-containing protein [Bryobacteraceae bacterium]|jgi:uncharacterized protein YndB with AHSA1/START domain|nr:SRPBCC domain-containing protein [Bryobacteraceae bacterium]
MSSSDNGSARAVANFAEGYVLATVEIAASPERVFQALASKEIVDWWVRPGVFDTREWSGDVRVGGRWRASGMAGGKPYVLEGQFLELDPPKKLVHTWHFPGAAETATTVTYLLEQLNEGTRLTIRHSGFPTGKSCANTSMGWETSLQRLAEILNANAHAQKR